MQERKELEIRHKLQIKDLNRQFVALDKIDKRELSSLKAAIRTKERPADRQTPIPQQISTSQRARRIKQKNQEFWENACDLQGTQAKRINKKEDSRKNSGPSIADDSKESLDKKQQEKIARRKKRDRGNDPGRTM